MRAMLGAGLLLALAGCAGRGSVFTGRTGADAVAALHARGAARGATPDAVIAALGPAVRVTRDTIANRHGAGIDTVVTVVHPSWAHTFLRLGADGSYLLTEAETTDSAEVLPGGLRIGESSRETITTRLGAPDNLVTQADTTVLAYRHPTDEAESWVELAVVNDALRLVRWIPYVD